MAIELHLPKVLLTSSVVFAFLHHDTVAQINRSGWTAWADSSESVSTNNSATNAIDGFLSSIWHTQFEPVSTPFPHNLTIDMKRIYNVSALRYTPRLDGCMNGNIGEYTLQWSMDGKSFYPPYPDADDVDDRDVSNFPDDSQDHDVYFATPVSARYLRINVYSEAGNRGSWASAAEINIFESGVPITAPRESPQLSNQGGGPERGDSHIGEVVGGLLGGIAAVLTLLLSVYFKCFRGRRRREA